MAFNKQIISNQKNTQKATGPQTAADKLATLKNAVKHSLISNDVVIKDESDTEFVTPYGSSKAKPPVSDSEDLTGQMSLGQTVHTDFSRLNTLGKCRRYEAHIGHTLARCCTNFKDYRSSVMAGR